MPRARKPQQPEGPSPWMGEVISYWGFAATRAEAFQHAFDKTGGNQLAAERMAFGLNVPALTADQAARFVPLSAITTSTNKGLP